MPDLGLPHIPLTGPCLRCLAHGLLRLPVISARDGSGATLRSLHRLLRIDATCPHRASLHIQ